MFGFVKDLISPVTEVVGGYIKGKQELSKIDLESKKASMMAEIEMKNAVTKSKIDMLLNEQDNNFKLDLMATENMKTSYKDELILFIFLTPLVMSFSPETQGYVVAGFQVLTVIPEWFMYLVIGQVVVIMGMRGMLDKFLNGRKLPTIIKDSEAVKK